MAINFCDERLDVKISCDKLCADFHSVNNLLSNDPNISRNGFRSEYFIRPPIDITFVSQITFDIMCIEIGLKLNEHKTNGIEIYSSKTDEKEFNLILRHFTDSDVINVRNVCFRPNGKLTAISMPKFTDNAEEVKIRSRFINNCYQTKQIRVKILKTTNSSVPCLSFMKVWAQPVFKTSQLIIDKIIGLNVCKTKNLHQISFYDKTNEDIKSDNKKRTFTEMSTKEDEKSLEIPSEFIDLITNEIMVTPVLLPSGKCIDKSTLDKYNQNECIWGRTPNDPFTSLPFTRDRHPLPNNILQIRIDSFLSENHHLIHAENMSSKRISGYSSTHSTNGKVVMSRLVDQQQQKPIKEDICSECKVKHKSCDDVLYKLSCDHIICRKQWLKKLNQLRKKCSLCNRNICNEDLVKVQKSM